MPEIAVSVIIPSWNGKDLLDDCLKSIIQNIKEIPAEIIVVDNGSTDGTREFLSEKFPSVNVLALKENLGFTSAVNRGIEISSGKYLLILNNDIIVLNNAIKNLLDFMMNNESVGIATSQLIYPDGNIQQVIHRFRSLSFTLAETFFIDRLSFFKKFYSERDLKSKCIFDDRWVMGAAMMIKREVIEDIGRFDEKSFTGDEDICFDAITKGWQIGVCKDSLMIHLHRKSSFTDDRGLDYKWIARMYFEFQRSACLSYIKRNPLWKGKVLFLTKKIASILRLFLSIILFFLTNDKDDLYKARIWGHYQFLCYPFEELLPFCDSVLPAKITIISPSLDVKGGISKQVRHFLESDVSKKYRVSHISTHQSGNKFLKLIRAICGYFEFSIQAFFSPPKLAFVYMSGDISFLRKSIIILLAKLRKIKVLLYCHSYDFDHFYSRSPHFFKSYIKYILNSVEKVVALSSYWKEALFYICGRNDIVIVPPFSPYITQLLSANTKDEESQERNILFMGTIEERKGIFDVLSAFSSIVGNLPYPCRLIVAGDGKEDKVKHIIEKNNLKNNVKLIGWIDEEEKIKLFEEAYLFVLPSYAEGFPLVLIEAMASGVPVVAGDIPPVRELISDGENGFLVEPGNKESLADVLEKVLMNEELCKKIGEEGRRLVKSKFLFNDNVYSLDKEIRSLLM